MSRDIVIQIIRKKSFELKAQQTTLGQHSAMLLNIISKIFLNSIIYNYNSLSETRTHFCPSYIENIGKLRQVGQSKISIGRGQPITSTRYIYIKQKSLSAAYSPNSLNLCKRIQSTRLSRLRNINHSRLNHVLKTCIVYMRLVHLLHLGGGNFSIRRRYCQNFMTGSLNSSCFMYPDMTRNSSYNSLIRL